MNILKYSALALAGAGMGLLAQSSIAAPDDAAESAASLQTSLSLTRVQPNGSAIHIMPTQAFATARAQALAAAGFAANTTSTTLTYYGGPVMTAPNIYIIYWVPPKLQTGAATNWSLPYQNLQTQFMTDYSGSGLALNNTQYYQQVGGVKTSISSVTKLGGVYVDTTAYPASNCKNSTTSGNCISDSLLQAEIKKVIALKGWPASGANNVYFLYTAKGEGSCDSTGACSGVVYCAYHSTFGTTAAPTNYAYIPYGMASGCGVSSANSPNNFVEADAAISVSSHELTEAITDPLVAFATVYGSPLAWYNATYGEIGDICNAQTFTTSINNHPYVLQKEYSNAKSACVASGP